MNCNYYPWYCKICNTYKTCPYYKILFSKERESREEDKAGIGVAILEISRNFSSPTPAYTF